MRKNTRKNLTLPFLVLVTLRCCSVGIFSLAMTFWGLILESSRRTTLIKHNFCSYWPELLLWWPTSFYWSESQLLDIEGQLISFLCCFAAASPLGLSPFPVDAIISLLIILSWLLARFLNKHSLKRGLRRLIDRHTDTQKWGFMFLKSWPLHSAIMFLAITRANRAKQIWIFRRIFILKFSDRSAVQADFSVQQQK